MARHTFELIFESRREDFQPASTERCADVGLSAEDVADLIERVEPRTVRTPAAGYRHARPDRVARPMTPLDRSVARCRTARGVRAATCLALDALDQIGHASRRDRPSCSIAAVLGR